MKNKLQFSNYLSTGQKLNTDKLQNKRSATVIIFAEMVHNFKVLCCLAFCGSRSASVKSQKIRPATRPLPFVRLWHGRLTYCQHFICGVAAPIGFQLATCAASNIYASLLKPMPPSEIGRGILRTVQPCWLSDLCECQSVFVRSQCVHELCLWKSQQSQSRNWALYGKESSQTF